MKKKPPIIISRLDLESLERIIEMNRRVDPYLEALQDELGRAVVVENNALPPGVVTMNSTARCIDESSGKEYVLTIIYPQRTATKGEVSVLAPIGTALLGLSVGQRIEWPSPSGKTLKLNLLSVECSKIAAKHFFGS